MSQRGMEPSAGPSLGRGRKWRLYGLVVVTAVRSPHVVTRSVALLHFILELIHFNIDTARYYGFLTLRILKAFKQVPP